VLYQLSATFIGFGLGNVRDWLVVCLFSCYIGFDISFAKNRPRTLDNAIDSACGLYLDIVNLFLRILMIIARNRK
jgi:FtsH-binding integral membrane protein